MTEVYISFDVESLGGNPFENPVVNWGFVAYKADRTKIDALNVNMSYPEGYVANPDTLEWFKKQPGYVKCTENPLPPKEGMKKIRSWIAMVSKGKKAVLVAYPTIYDGTMLYNYWFRYLGHPSGGRGPGFTIIDIRSYAAGALGIDIYDASKRKALAKFRPAEEDCPHTHCGVDDADEQMQLFFNIRDAQQKK